MKGAAIPTPGRSNFLLCFLRCAAEFWRGPTAWRSWTLTALLVVVVILELVIQYRLNFWNRDFFNAMERKDATGIGEQALLFVPLAIAGIALAMLAMWGRMAIQRRWRKWLSRHLIEQWLANGRYRRHGLLVDDLQNPEYRIAEDARVATDAPVDFALGLLMALMTALTFIGVLWSVGGDLTTDVLGRNLTIPGYLVVAAVVYAMATTGAMLVIGRRLVQVYEGKNQTEAEFRQSATRLRENALQKNDLVDRSALHQALEQVVARWRDLSWQLLQTTMISHGNSLLAPVIALTLCSPKYLAGTMSLGEVTQAAVAFVTVQGAFNWIVDNYPRLADWASSANRVGALLESLDGLDRHGEAAPAAEYRGGSKVAATR